MTASLKDFGVRAASALVLGAVMLGSLFFAGVWGLAVVAAIIASGAMWEFVQLTRRGRTLPEEMPALAGIAALPFAAAAWGPTGLLAAGSVLVVAMLVRHVLVRQLRLADTAVTVFGAAYIGLGASHLLLMRRLEDGVMLVLATIMSVWANDVFAYLAGSSFGRRPLAPRISPKKTWEGLAAGTVGTTAAWLGIGSLGTDLAFGPLVAVGLVASLAAVFGDLVESRFKREAQVKDSGALLPGHGGMLDRFDSFLVVTIVVYHVLLAVGAR